MDTAVTVVPEVTIQPFIPIPIDRDHLYAVGLFAADGDIRECLNGVLVHVLAGGDVRLVATNGKAMGIAYTPNTEVLPPDPDQIIIPIEVVTLFRKGDGNQLYIFSDDCETFRLEGPGLSVNFTSTPSTFPEYERILPATTSGEASDFDPELLMLFNKAAKIYAGKARDMKIEHNGAGPALVHLPTEHFVGVVMPWHSNLSLIGLPAWIKARGAYDESDGGVSLPGLAPEGEEDDLPLSTIGDNERAA